MPWTQFWDMHSGGGTKEASYERIYIEAPEEEAKVIFYNRFGHNPDRVSCTCCGSDYSISEYPTLEQATAYHRGCDWDNATDGYVERQSQRAAFTGDYRTLDEYRQAPDVLIIPASEIKPEERVGEVPEQGYVWRD